MLFYKIGLLKPRFISTLNTKDVLNILIYLYIDDMKHISIFSELLEYVCKHIQDAQHEQMILKIASAYRWLSF